MNKIVVVLSMALIGCSPATDRVPEGEQPQSERMETKEKTTELNYYENPRYKGKPTFFVAEDGCYIYHSGIDVYEYTLPADFRLCYKHYYRDGSLEKLVISELGWGVAQKSYDVEGNLISEHTSESRLQTVKLDGLDYLSFFEKEGWFDRSTGKTAFREEPFPLNTGELTYEVFRKLEFSSSPEDSSVMYVRIYALPEVPRQFLEKYGMTRADGSKCLEGVGDGPGGEMLDVTYEIYLEKNAYEVSWKSEGYIM